MQEVIATSQTVVLHDYHSRGNGYLLAPPTGRYERLSEKRPLAGFGTVMKVGLAPRVRVLAAVFAADNRLWFQLGQHCFDLHDRKVLIRTRFPLIRTLIVHHQNEAEFSIQYWAPFKELSEWPAEGDIFHFVSRLTKSEDEMIRTQLRWTAAARGADLRDEGVRQQIEDQFRQLRPSSH